MRIHLLLLLLIAGICTNTACSQSNKEKQYIINICFEEETSYKNVDKSAMILGGPSSWSRDTTIIIEYQ